MELGGREGKQIEGAKKVRLEDHMELPYMGLTPPPALAISHAGS